MIVVNNICDMRTAIKEYKSRGFSIGFVPTMGYLHQGHMSLVRESKKNNDVTVVSIYVNPTQFGPNEDLEKYPQDLEKDSMLLRNEGVDILFYPRSNQIYPEGFSTFVTIDGEFTNKMCGESRPTHFRGVTTVVSKLFNIVSPSRAYFGQKDAQQLAIIRRMAFDLNFDIEIIGLPIIREANGLALSSRNVYLSDCQKESAGNIYKSLKLAKELISNGEYSTMNIKNKISDLLIKIEDSKIDYIEIVNYNTFERIDVVKGHVLLAVAVWVGKARLIDNIILEV